MIRAVAHIWSILEKIRGEWGRERISFGGPFMWMVVCDRLCVSAERVEVHVIPLLLSWSEARRESRADPVSVTNPELPASCDLGFFLYHSCSLSRDVPVSRVMSCTGAYMTYVCIWHVKFTKHKLSRWMGKGCFAAILGWQRCVSQYKTSWKKRPLISCLLSHVFFLLLWGFSCKLFQHLCLYLGNDKRHKRTCSSVFLMPWILSISPWSLHTCISFSTCVHCQLSLRHQSDEARTCTILFLRRISPLIECMKKLLVLGQF